MKIFFDSTNRYDEIIVSDPEGVRIKSCDCVEVGINLYYFETDLEEVFRVSGVVEGVIEFLGYVDPNSIDPVITSWDNLILKDLLERVSTGVGPNTLKLTVQNSNQKPVCNCSVIVTQGEKQFSTLTDLSGKAVFKLLPGEWKVDCLANGFVFSSENLNIETDVSKLTTLDTLDVIPPLPELGRVNAFSYVVNQQGEPLKGVKVELRLVKMLKTDYGTLIAPSNLIVESDSKGLCMFENCVSGAVYQYSIVGGKEKLRVTIPKNVKGLYKLGSSYV